MSGFAIPPTLSVCITSCRNPAHWQLQSSPSFGTTVTCNVFKPPQWAQLSYSPQMFQSPIFPRRLRRFFDRRFLGSSRPQAWRQRKASSRPDSVLEPSSIRARRRCEQDECRQRDRVRHGCDSRRRHPTMARSCLDLRRGDLPALPSGQQSQLSVHWKAARDRHRGAARFATRLIDRQPSASHLARLVFAIPSAISAIVTADRKRSDECKSIHSMSSGRLATVVGDVAEMTLVSTR